MKYISRKFPNITACAMTFVDGVGETEDQETIDYLAEHGESLCIYAEGTEPGIEPVDDPFERMAAEQAGAGWADMEVARTEGAETPANGIEEIPLTGTTKRKR